MLLREILIFDRNLFEFITLNLNPAWLVSSCEFIVDKHNLQYLFILLWLVYLIKEPRSAVLLLFSALIIVGVSEGLASTLKSLVQRYRPSHEMGLLYDTSYYSWPSAHALNGLALSHLLVTWFKNKSFYLLGLIIGIARVFSNYHFPLDVFSGWVLGLISSACIIKVYFLIKKKSMLSLNVYAES